MRRLAVLVATMASLAAADAAAAREQVLGTLACTDAGAYTACKGPHVRSWDGEPLSVDVYLPDDVDAGLPLAAILGGYPGYKGSATTQFLLESAASWARRGYAVLTLSPRGMRSSCGPEQTLQMPELCAGAESHIADSRYEARDIQHLAGVLVDEGVVDAEAVGVVGESYGGGTALQLAVLRDRIHLPDGRFAPWRSPAGRPMRLAAAAALTTWSDLAYSLVPNGRARDDRNSPEATGLGPIGVPLGSFFTAFTAAGVESVSNGPASQSSLSRWWAAMHAGEPFSPAARESMADFATFHSAHAIPLDGRPAPTLLGNGLTDNLFPVQEVLRHVNRVKDVPGARLAQVHGEFGGHGRTQNPRAQEPVVRARVASFFDHHVRGDEAVEPPSGVEVLVPTCGEWDGDRVHARSWGELATSSAVVRGVAPQLVAGGGSPFVARALDPVIGENRCLAQDAADQPGVATYRSAPVGATGMFLVGSPEITASLSVLGAPAEHAQVAARLWDVDVVAGTQRLTRGLYRPRGAAGESFQLNGTAYRFAPGHVAKLELLTHDAPYGRPSNLPFSVQVAGLELRLPIR